MNEWQLNHLVPLKLLTDNHHHHSLFGSESARLVTQYFKEKTNNSLRP